LSTAIYILDRNLKAIAVTQNPVCRMTFEVLSGSPAALALAAAEGAAAEAKGGGAASPSDQGSKMPGGLKVMINKSCTQHDY